MAYIRRGRVVSAATASEHATDRTADCVSAASAGVDGCAPPVAGVKAVRTNPAVQAVAGGWNGRRDGTKRSADNGYAAYPLIMTQNRYLFTLEKAPADGRKEEAAMSPWHSMQMARAEFCDRCWEEHSGQNHSWNLVHRLLERLRLAPPPGSLPRNPGPCDRAGCPAPPSRSRAGARICSTEARKHSPFMAPSKAHDVTSPPAVWRSDGGSRLPIRPRHVATTRHSRGIVVRVQVIGGVGYHLDVHFLNSPPVRSRLPAGLDEAGSAFHPAFLSE